MNICEKIVKMVRTKKYVPSKQNYHFVPKIKTWSQYQDKSLIYVENFKYMYVQIDDKIYVGERQYKNKYRFIVDDDELIINKTGYGECKYCKIAFNQTRKNIMHFYNMRREIILSTMSDKLKSIYMYDFARIK